MKRLDPALSRNAGLAAGALLASSATLVCCVLLAVLGLLRGWRGPGRVGDCSAAAYLV